MKRARHCSGCGGVLRDATVEGRSRGRCEDCGAVVFENPACAAAGVVLNGSGEVLLVRRAIEPWRGHWALPAGYQEVDEGPETALAREVEEEAGVEVEIVGLLDLIFVDQDPRKPANVAIYLCRARGPRPALQPQSDDVHEAGWFSLDALPADIGFENYERILSRLRDSTSYPPSAWMELEGLLGEQP